MTTQMNPSDRGFVSPRTFGLNLGLTLLALGLLGHAVNQLESWAAFAGLLSQVDAQPYFSTLALNGLLGVGCCYALGGLWSAFRSPRSEHSPRSVA